MIMVRTSPETSSTPSSVFLTSYRDLKGTGLPTASKTEMSPAVARASGEGRSSLSAAVDGTCGILAMLAILPIN